MSGSHWIGIILACRAACNSGETVSMDTARDIAVLWHSPSPHSRGITAFSHNGDRLPSLRSEVERELRDIMPPHGNACDRLTLRALLAWIDANPIEVIRYEHVVFLDGDSADEILQIIYPDWSYGSASTGWPDGAATALAYVMGWDYGEATDVADSYERPDATYGSYSEESDAYVLAWNFGQGWVSLHRKVKEVG